MYYYVEKAVREVLEEGVLGDRGSGRESSEQSAPSSSCRERWYGGAMTDRVWKMYSLGETEYFEDEDNLITALLTAAIRGEYRRDERGEGITRSWHRRTRLRSWLMRNHPNPDVNVYEADREERLHCHWTVPIVHELIDGEWVEIPWTLVQPSVTLGDPESGGRS